jgi:hypothetical protein
MSFAALKHLETVMQLDSQCNSLTLLCICPAVQVPDECQEEVYQHFIKRNSNINANVPLGMASGRQPSTTAHAACVWAVLASINWRSWVRVCCVQMTSIVWRACRLLHLPSLLQPRHARPTLRGCATTRGSSATSQAPSSSA